MSGILIDSKERYWPAEIEEDFERVRPLGEGAFGIVWLAKAKGSKRVDRRGTANTDPIIDHGEDDNGDTSAHSKNAAKNRIDDVPPYVAIKQINATHDEEKQYAAREIAILSEINHPNVVRCMRSVEMPRSRIVVLTLADGPDLNELVQAGGALSISLVRLAARHLISAVAYLHGRGVIHRDIKPDNCILTKTNSSTNITSGKSDWISNDAIWDDKAVFDAKEWKIVLVDFGFAKALSPKEVGMHKNARTSVRNLVQRGIERQESRRPPSPSKAIGNTPTPIGRKNSSRMKRNASFQRTPIRAMSAIGTRAYAAPEVMKVREKSENNPALSDHVSDYGLIADAYSIGVTIKVLLTGVPADKNEMEYISSQENILLDILSAIFSCGKKTGGKRKKRFKFLDESPKPAREIVMKLMLPVYAERLTVPLAREELWIKGGMNDDDPVVALPVGDIEAGNDDPIKCLNCASP